MTRDVLCASPKWLALRVALLAIGMLAGGRQVVEWRASRIILRAIRVCDSLEGGRGVEERTRRKATPTTTKKIWNRLGSMRPRINHKTDLSGVAALDGATTVFEGPRVLQ